MTTVTPMPRIPGPRPTLLIGRRGNLMRFFHDPVGYMRMLYRHYGTLAALTKGDTSFIFGFGPEYNRLVLTDDDRFHQQALPIAVVPDSALDHLSRGLIGMNGPSHRQQRRLISPAFHNHRIESYRDPIIAITGHTLDRWQPGQQLDIGREMRYLTLRIANRIFFGLTDDIDSDSLSDMIDEWFHLAPSGPVVAFPFNLPGTPYRRLLAISERLRARLLAMINTKRAAEGTQQDILAALLAAYHEAGASLTETQLIGHMNLLVVAAYETTASALAWTLLLLALHPRVLSDLLDELDGRLHGDAPSSEQASQLTLLDQVIKESMRLLPPVAFHMRYATAPCEIGMYALPKGAQIVVSQYITQHMPDLYPEPERFLPERWGAINPSPYAFMPFGSGPHACIGAQFGLLELKIILPMVLQRYRLAVVPGTRIDRRGQFTLLPSALPMVITPLDRAIPPVSASIRGTIHEMVELR